MFQVGKILVSRIFTSFGTAAIAANAVSGVIASFVFMPAQAFAIAMLTIVGQCVGARDYEGAKRFTRKLMRLTWGGVTAFSVLILLFLEPLLGAFNLSAEAKDIAKGMLWAHSVCAPVSWAHSFTLPNALRAAGDARYCMAAAVISMWAVRVIAAYLLAYSFGLGPLGVWYAMIADWCLRAACYTWRWYRGRWQNKQVLPGGD
jgi:Na+-driven multidrug efflux pump